MKHIVFDVESIGLHGEGYAVGYVVCDSHVTPMAEGMFACQPGVARGAVGGHIWVVDYAPELPINCETPREVRENFWKVWRHWVELDKDDKVYLWADCAWPVEARFLLACIEDDPVSRDWLGPYPLMDIAPLLYARGRDPILSIDRLGSELPIHHPLNDARQSARVLKGVLSHAGMIGWEVTK